VAIQIEPPALRALANPPFFRSSVTVARPASENRAFFILSALGREFRPPPNFGRMRDYVIERIAPANNRATP